MQITIVCMCLLIHYAFSTEPLCSRFDYNEALLEKMIRTEVKFEQFASEFTQLREDVKLAVKQLTDNVQVMMDVVKRSLNDVQQDRQDMLDKFVALNQTTNSKVDELMKDGKDTFEQQERRVDIMMKDFLGLNQTIFAKVDERMKESENKFDTAATPIVGFKATDVTNKNPSAGEVLVFPTVLFNKGNGYNPSSGVFLAPVDGLYLLAVQICMPPKGYMATRIMVNDKAVGRGFTYDQDGYHCNTADAIVYMQGAERAYVKVLGRDEGLFTDSYRQLSFSGCLVNKGE